VVDPHRGLTHFQGVTDLSQLAASLSDAGGDAPLPVDAWNPTHCGSMDLTIKADGTWWHEGQLMTRAPLVRLFSRILRKDPDGYVLVTPAEKVSIHVEDVPFLAVDYDLRDRDWVFKTNVGDEVTLDTDHRLELRHSEAVGQRAPYLWVRGELQARVARAAYYRMVSDAETDGSDLVVRSAGATFRLPMGDDA